MIKKEDIGYYLSESCLTSFGVVNQFIELKFDNPRFESIIFNIDCNITSNNELLNNDVDNFKVYSNDTYQLSYFIYFNLRRISKVTLNSLSVILFFEDTDAELKFDLSKEESDMSINFLHRNSETYEGFEFSKNNITRRSNILH